MMRLEQKYLIQLMTSLRKPFMVEICSTVGKRAKRTLDSTIETTQLLSFLEKRTTITFSVWKNIYTTLSRLNFCFSLTIILIIISLCLSINVRQTIAFKIRTTKSSIYLKTYLIMKWSLSKIINLFKGKCLLWDGNSKMFSFAKIWTDERLFLGIFIWAVFPFILLL